MEAPESASLRVLDGKYQLVRKLGSGGMGTVYEGLHLGTRRRVAIKLISCEKMAADDEVVSRFRREAMTTGAIDSQHIAQVLDTGDDDETGSPYMVMELLSGEDVEETLNRLGPLPPDLALRIVAQACLGLQKAHDNEVIHRDIKPANVFLARRDGGERVAKLVDFGIAKMKRDHLASSRGRSVTRGGVLLGSPLYMSPEQAFGKKTLDHRTDIWSLGVVLYELLTGAAPHAHVETVGELIISICQVPPRPVQEVAPWVPREVAWITHRALALAPLQRFGSAQEMYTAIRALLHGGHSIDESMLVTLAPEARAVVAPRMSVTPAMRAPSASMAEMPPVPPLVVAAKPPSAQTTIGFEQSDEILVVPKRDLRPVAIGAAVLVLLACSVVFVASRSSHDPAATGAATHAPPPVVPAPKGSVSDLPEPPPPDEPVPVRVAAAPSAPLPPPPVTQARSLASKRPHSAAPAASDVVDPASVR